MKTAWLVIAGALAVVPGPNDPAATGQQVYRPTLAVPESMEPFLKQLEPGNDAFPLEGQAKELDARLQQLSDALRAGTPQTAGITTALLDPGFRGGRLLPPAPAAVS